MQVVPVATLDTSAWPSFADRSQGYPSTDTPGIHYLAGDTTGAGQNQYQCETLLNYNDSGALVAVLHYFPSYGFDVKAGEIHLWATAWTWLRDPEKWMQLLDEVEQRWGLDARQSAVSEEGRSALIQYLESRSITYVTVS